MSIEKDPTDDIREFEDVFTKFEEVYSDINSPGKFIARIPEEIKSYAIVLDGHSTVLLFSNDESKEQKWSVVNELGQYKYTPDRIGDGLLIIPHSFYLEFLMTIQGVRVKTSGNFEATEIAAIVIPFKEIGIENFFDSLENRIGSIFNNSIKVNLSEHQLGSKLPLNEDILSEVNLKFSLMGVKVKSIIVQSREKLEEDEKKLDDKILSVGPPVEKELRKKKKSGIPAPDDTPKPGLETSSSGAGGAGPVPAMDEVIVATAEEVSLPDPSPPSPSQPPSPAPKMAPSTAPMPQPAPASPARSASIAERFEEEETLDLEEEIDEEDDFGFDDADVDEDLLASEIEPTEEKMTLKHTHATYFERMVPNRAYPLSVKITEEEIGVKKSITSVLSGERITEKEETLVLSTDKDLTIKPEFPGCMVVPESLRIDVQKSDVSVEFYVTPLALGKLDGKIRFIQDGKDIHSMLLPTKVINHRLSKWVAWFGAGVGAIPAMLAFAFNQTPGQFMTDRLDTWNLGSISGLGYIIPTILTGLMFGLSGFLYWSRKPSRTARSVAFPR